jgi:peptidoglycan hydrolase-like protein with peptidoglycan-binding domain
MKLALGSRGEDVIHLQVLLNYLGGGDVLIEDGIFGNKTRARVIQYQKSNSLAADGIVGPLTGKSLTSQTLKSILEPGGFLPQFF